MREFEVETGHADAGGLSIADLESGDCFQSYCKTLRDGTSMSLCHFFPPGGANLDYAIRPSRRGQGHDAALLAAMLPIARSQGIDPVFLICDARHAIEACGGIEQQHHAQGMRHYLIPARDLLRTS